MQHSAAFCHSRHAENGHRDPADADSKTSPLPRVAPAQQWATTTPSRLTGDTYSWLQAVHWVHGTGHYTPRSGPGFCDTTLRLARLLADLTPCRPGITYLMRRLRCSERTVQYHLAVLRETGLLVYTAMGGREKGPEGKGATRRASEFARAIPAAFDEALGIRTVGEGPARRVIGVAEEHRKSIAALARKASRKLRSKSRRPGGRCTPMGGGHLRTESCGLGGEVTTTAGQGSKPTTTPKNGSSNRKAPRKATIGGRRVTAAGMALGDRLARQVRARVPWLRRATHNQLRWVLADAAEQQWTLEHTLAWISEVAAVHGRGAGILWRPDRPHAFLAHALRQDQAGAEEHAEQDALASQAVPPNAEFLAVMASLRAPQEHTAPAAETSEAEDIASLRYHGAKDPDLVIAAVEGFGLHEAIRIYGRELVHRAINLTTTSPHLTIHSSPHRA